MGQRVVIVGAGPTGLGAGWRLAELGHRDWTIYERASHVGGLASSYRDSAGFTYDVGVHVLHSHYRYFDHLVDRLLGDECNRLVRRSWIWMLDRWIPYPLQNNIRHLPPDALMECLAGLVDAQGKDPAGAGSFAEWVDAVFGDGIARHFMRPYNLKVWAHPLELMDKGWIADRVSVIDLKQVLANLVHGRDDTGWGPNSTFVYPLHGGTGGLFNRIVPHLGDHLQLDRELAEVDVEARRLRFADGGEDGYDVLVSALPIPELLGMIRPRPELPLAAAGGLKHSRGLVVGIGIQGECPSDKCWTYFPEATCPFYRLTYLSNYSPHIAPAGHYLLLTETSYSEHREEDGSGIVDRVVEGLVANRVIPPEDRKRIVATRTQEVEHFYPIPTLGRDAALAVIQPYLMDNGIYSRGRFGAWRYEISNMDHCVMQGVEVVNRVLLGDPELTWTPAAGGGPVAVPGPGLAARRRRPSGDGRARPPQTATA